MKSKNKLPSTLWENVLLAVHDLELVEQNELYTVNMNNWHNTVRGNEVCRVCLAGSVMAMTKELDPDSCVYELDDEFTPREVRIFSSLDHIRLHETDHAIHVFFKSKIPVRVVRSMKKNKESVDELNTLESKYKTYINNQEEFKSNMREIAGHLKTLGI